MKLNEKSVVANRECDENLEHVAILTSSRNKLLK